MTVLVLAAETDRTADSVITGLTERNVPVMRVDTSWFPQNMSLDAEFRDGRCSGVLRTAHHEIDLDDIRSVWVRATAVYRPLQWAVAARCGLAVPRSLVTNDPAAVKRFAAGSRTGVVVKPLTANLLYEDSTYKMGWTRKLSTDDLADLRGVDTTAHLVQDWVEKAWECRVVMVGDEVFAVAITAHSIFRSPLWAHIETAWQQWTDLGSPHWHEFGLTATPTQHTIWFRNPDGPSWPLPVPHDTAEPLPDAPH